MRIDGKIPKHDHLFMRFQGLYVDYSHLKYLTQMSLTWNKFHKKNFFSTFLI